MENYDDALIEISIHNLLRMASRSSSYHAKVNNPRLEKFLRCGRKDAFEFYDRWTLEEISVMLKKMTEFGFYQGSERLDEYEALKFIELKDQYLKKPHVVRNYLLSILQRKKFKKANLSAYLSLMDVYFEVIISNEDTTNIMKRALYIIEDNLKAGDAEYDEERAKLTKLVNRNKDYINSDKIDELQQIKELERLEKEIKQSLG